MKAQKLSWVWLVWLIAMLALVACSAPAKPVVKIASTIGGVVYENQDVTIQSTATDDKGVSRIELYVDNIVAVLTTVDPPQKSVTAPQTIKLTAGTHTISIKAFDLDNLISDPAIIALTVLPAPAPAPTQVPAPGPTGVPTGVPTSVVPTAQTGPTATPAPGPCSNNSAFIQHVTVPDGTPWRPNQQFNKIWRVQNIGTCTWSPKYALAFVSGEPMTNVQAMPLTGNVAPGQTTDILISMNAPAAPGNHSGKWQLRDDNNTFFGVMVNTIISTIPQPPQSAIASPGNGFQFTTGATVRITFQGSSTTEVQSVALFINGAQQAKQTSRTPATVINGTFDWKPAPGNYDLYAVATDVFGQQTTSAHIGGTIQPPACQASINFRADRTSLNAGESTMLRWDVDCVKAVYLDGQGVAGHDARNVAPGSTKTYILRVTKNDNSNEDRQVTIAVNQPVPPTAVPPTAVPPTAVPPAPTRHVSGNWASTDGKYLLELHEALGCPGPSCGVAGRMIEVTAGAPVIEDISGNINWNSGAFSFAISRPGAPSFSGTVNANSTQITGSLGSTSLTFHKQ